MKFKASCLYALRMISPKAQTGSNGRKSLFGAIFGVALSLVPLVMVLMVADGMIEGITGRMIGLSSYHLQAAQMTALGSSHTENIAILENLSGKILGLDGVRAVFIERQGIALAAGKKSRIGCLIRAVPENIFTKSEAFKTYLDLIDGEAAFPTAKSAVIGKKIAGALELSVGDSIRLITTKTLAGGKISPQILSCTVSGIVSSGYEEIDGLWIFLPLKTGFEYLSSASSQIRLGIEIKDPFSDQLSDIYWNIAGFLPAGFRIYRWNDLNTAQYENYASTKMLLLFIMILILLIASVNISSALVMVVIERQREIAILKSMGASSAGITLSFLITGVLCGLSGLCIGLPLGFACGTYSNEILHFIEKIVNLTAKMWYLIGKGEGFIPVSFLDPAYYLQTIPVVTPYFELTLISAGTIVLSALASVLPARRAGKEKPLHILRKM